MMIKKNNLSDSFKYFVIYQLLFWLIGIFCCFILFGYSDAVKIFKAAPDKLLSGTLMALSSLLASGILFRFKADNLRQRVPYPYFMFGFYTGNTSILVFNLLTALINHSVIWQFPDVLMIVIGPLVELIIAYIFGFAFLALIPSIASALILYWLNKNYLEMDIPD